MVASNWSLASKPQTPLWLGPIPVPVIEQGHSAVPARAVLAWEGGPAAPPAVGDVFGKGAGLWAMLSCSRPVPYRDLPWCCLVRGEGETCCIHTMGFRWSLLNSDWRLLVGSIYFNFSHQAGVWEGSSLQALPVLAAKRRRGLLCLSAPAAFLLRVLSCRGAACAL